jgi:hypothetical protein
MLKLLRTHHIGTLVNLKHLFDQRTCYVTRRRRRSLAASSWQGVERSPLAMTNFSRSSTVYWVRNRIYPTLQILQILAYILRSGPSNFCDVTPVSSNRSPHVSISRILLYAPKLESRFEFVKDGNSISSSLSLFVVAGLTHRRDL